MKKISITLENCYGIRSLTADFDFSRQQAYVIYAPNGIMKSSFARTFKDISKGLESKDRIFTKRLTLRNVTDENNNDIEKDNIFVIEPYDKNFKSTRVSNLLVNKDLKSEYDTIHKGIDEKKNLLVNELKKVSGVKKGIENELAEAITHDSNKFYPALLRVKDEVLNGEHSELSEVDYQVIFNDKVLAILSNEDFKQSIKEYIDVYDRLISASTFFKKGIFNHNNAEEIAKNLDSNGFFRASHTVNVHIDGEKIEIKNIDELKKSIQKEKEVILDNEQLTSLFEDMDKKLRANEALRKFREYIDNNRFIIPELDNINKLKQDIWIAYLTDCKETYHDLVESYEDARRSIEKIISQAKHEKTKWLDVIDIFNERFCVPFIVKVQNQDDVILKRDVPNIQFDFKDNGTEVPVSVEEGELLDILSNGELRALYLLNIIFEIEARKETMHETLFIIDDIADSFDYKNKYAIAEYLKDISSTVHFYQIILSHNFDFYRTMTSRLGLVRENRLHTLRTNDGISLKSEKYQKNPLIHWKNHLTDNDQMMVSTIPFMRNLAEYCGKEAEEEKLTSLLHIKSDSNTITRDDILEIARGIFQNTSIDPVPNGTQQMLDVIYNTAENIQKDTNEDVELESKIVLSIAIRLKTEEFLIRKIADSVFIESISKNQTRELINKYKEKYPSELDKIRLIEEVNLMTPENIHLNSFMYEPILDMACDNLKKLYSKISTSLI